MITSFIIALYSGMLRASILMPQDQTFSVCECTKSDNQGRQVAAFICVFFENIDFQSLAWRRCVVWRHSRVAIRAYCVVFFVRILLTTLIYVSWDLVIHSCGSTSVALRVQFEHLCCDVKGHFLPLRT